MLEKKTTQAKTVRVPVRNGPRIAKIAGFLVLSHACAFAASPPTRPAKPSAAATRLALEANAPWGAESKGLAMRLLTKGSFCQGEPADFVLEVKNVSRERKFLADVFDTHYTKTFLLIVTGPDGKALAANTVGGYTIPAGDFRPIEPNEVWRVPFPDVGGHFTAPDKTRRLYLSGFRQAGRYTARASYMGAPLPPNGEGVSDELKAGNWTGQAVSNEVAFTVAAPTKDDLRVHEWGVFTVHSDVAYANATRKAEWAEMPEFFFRQFPTRKLRYMPMIVEKPIVYFYSDHAAMQVRVRVRFAEGAPVVWWPAAEYPFDGGVGALQHDPPRKSVSDKTPFDYLAWVGWIGRKVPGGSHYGLGHERGEDVYEEVAEAKLPEGSWVAHARIDGPLPVTVVGSQSAKGRMWGQESRQTERFLFYDGLLKAGDWLRFVSRVGNSVTVQNAAKFDLGDVFLIDRADEKAVAVGFAVLRGVKTGAKATATLAPLSVKDFASQAPAELRKTLLAAGLYAAEADSILKIWEKGFFSHTGLTAIYLLPQTEYDRMLPLEIDPPPGETLRVGIVLAPRMEAAGQVAKAAAELLKKLDADDFKVREAATKGLLELGPAVIPHVEACLKSAGSNEVQTRCRDILESLDAAQWLKDAGAGR